MIKMLSLSTVIAVGMVGGAFAQSACTAVVSHVSGLILVNQGHGFQRLVHRVVLHPGDVIMASRNSSGVVDFSDGTAEKLVHGNAIRISAGAPCAGAPPAVEASEPPVGEATGGVSPGLIGAGAIALIVGGSIAAASFGNKNSSPVSP